jgi:CysZ protein
MNIIRDMGLGARGFLKAFRFTVRNGMGWMFLVPVVLWISIAIGVFSLLEEPLEVLNTWVASYLAIPVDTGATDWWNGVLDVLNNTREMVLGFVLRLAIAYLMFVANKYIVLVLLSPLLAYASERTEEVLTGQRFPFSWSRLAKDALRGAGVAVRNGALEIVATLVIWALTLVLPILTPVSVVVLFTISSYFYGFSTFDYVFERKRMRIGESVRAVNERLGAVVANGILFNLFMKVPLFGVMFAPVMAAVGATLTLVPGPMAHRGPASTTGE